MKKVLIFSLTYIPYSGGAELAIKEITDRIEPKEYSFDMITLRFDRNLPPVERIGSVNVHRIGFAVDGPKISDRSMPFVCRLAKAFFPFTSYWKAQTLHRVQPFDLVWAMMANQAGFGALFFKLANPSVPYVLELQDGNTLEQIKKRRPLMRVIWSLYRAIYLRSDRIKAISHFIKRLARDIGYHGPIEVIPNGVDIAKFSVEFSEEALTALKERFGKKVGDVFLFTASRLVLSRGVEDIIRALAYLPGNVKLLIAGDGEDRKKLEQLAEKLRVHDRVIFLGHIGHDELPRYFKISDIFVRPSLIEGMGSAFVEAFAAGIPVVATPVGGIPDFLADPIRNPEREPTGIFCNVRDPESIARAVTLYMGNPELTARIVKNARALAADKYGWHTIARAMLERIFAPVTDVPSLLQS